MSISNGLLSTNSSTFFTVSLYSLSVNKTLVSACSRMKAIALASSLTFSALSTAPVIGTPKCASNVSGVLAPMNDTVSPLPMPIFCKADASKQQRL